MHSDQPARESVLPDDPIDDGCSQQAAGAQAGEQLAVAGITKMKAGGRKNCKQDRVRSVDEA